MKKLFLFVFSVCCLLFLSACSDETELKTEVIGDTLRIHLPKVEIFQMIKLV